MCFPEGRGSSGARTQGAWRAMHASERGQSIREAPTAVRDDLANQQTKITYPNTKSVTRAFDKAGRLEKVTDWSSNITKFTYNADSAQATTLFPSETKTKTSTPTTTRTR